ncbi:secondary thiamine-phosphate synthase enzyme YjbQ [candidate division KSB1 bacterium]
MMKDISVPTRKHTEFINITSGIQRAVNEIGIKDGVCYVFTPHTTAAVTINENADPDVTRDIIMELEKMVPWRDAEYHHSEGNSAAHIKSSIVGATETVFVEDGKLVLGTWQSLYFCEFDGPRTRRVYVKVVG